MYNQGGGGGKDNRIPRGYKQNNVVTKLMGFFSWGRRGGGGRGLQAAFYGIFYSRINLSNLHHTLTNRK